MVRDEHGRQPDDPLYGHQQPMNANEQDFLTLENHLDTQETPPEVRAALAGLRERYEVGKRMEAKRADVYRKTKTQLAAAQKKLKKR